MPIEHPVSAGGVVYRRQGDELQVVICWNRERDTWGLPKGTPNPGESVEECALREVREETGLETNIVGKVGSIRYWFSSGGTRYHKTVHHFLMEPVGGSLDQHDPEFDLVQWTPVGEALRNLTYKNEVGMVAQAIRLIQGEQTPRPTRAKRRGR
ncbi:MAG: NUDIX hydrolase [Chloroflexi bacterium]|nr:NUDIX hydrolase [Chloroflexota bacterium]